MSAIGPSSSDESDGHEDTEIIENLGRSTALSPSLSAFFGENEIRAGGFAKAVQSVGLSSFDEADRIGAIDLMYQNDPDAKRLLALMAIARLPKPLSAWVRIAVRDRLSRIFDADVDPNGLSLGQIGDAIRKRFPSLLEAKSAAERRGCFSAMRVVAAWLLTERHLDPWEVVEFCSSVLGRNQSNAAKLLLTAVYGGTNRDLSIAASVCVLGRRRLVDTENELARMKDEASRLRLRSDALGAENSQLRSSIDDLQRNSAQLASEMNDLSKKLEIERQHAAYDFAELQANNATLLRERIAPLIRDAIDALEIEVPAPDLAVRRLKRAVSSIEESLK